MVKAKGNSYDATRRVQRLRKEDFRAEARGKPFGVRKWKSLGKGFHNVTIINPPPSFIFLMISLVKFISILQAQILQIFERMYMIFLHTM